MNYGYTLRKMLELLGEDRFVPFLKPLKSASKVYAQDQIWAAICARVGWQYIESGVTASGG